MSRDPKSRGRPAASRRVVLMLGAILTIATLPAQAQESEGVLWDLSIEEVMELDLVTVSVLGSHTHLKGEWMVGYKYMIMGMDGNLDGTPQLTTQDVLDSYMVSPLAMTMEMHMVDVMYAPSVQAPCINIYQQLVPGITNVTNRARYYSFYPWLVWAYNQAETSRTHDDFVEWLRGGDCIFSMIAIRHRIVCGDDDYRLHDAALIGTDTLGSVVTGLDDVSEIELSRYTTRAEGDSNRYFKNKFGGLGQYYLGTFAQLGLMDRQGDEVGYTARGGDLAEALDSSVDRELFVDTLLHGRVTAHRLDELSSFCPCHLVDSPSERDLLVSLFFGPDIPGEEHGEHRRASLLMNLDLIEAVDDAEHGSRYNQQIFRACAYSGVLPGGRHWSPVPVSEVAREGWAAYERNELLSFAVQCIFWVTLRAVEELGPSLRGTDELGEWFARGAPVADASSKLGDNTFARALRSTKAGLPPVADYQQSNHEISLAGALADLQGADDPRYGEVLELAGRLLLSVSARSQGHESPYGPLSFPADYFAAHPISLYSLREHSDRTWRGMSLPEWYGWLASRWGAEAHLRVALRKLRFQSRDTFHISPTDSGLKVLAEPTPTLTTPRFATTMQILQDLGVTRRTPDGSQTRLTDLGQSLRG